MDGAKGPTRIGPALEVIKDDLFEFHEAYKLASDSGVSMTKLIDAARCLEQTPSLETRLNNIKIEIQNSERQKQNGLNWVNC